MTQNHYTTNLFYLSIYPLVLGTLNFSNTAVYAQITPDNTLGAESSVVTPNATVKGQSADLIQGGATRGGNLFHSFQDFNVRELQRVYFANPDGIGNILSRVTGGNLSQILGTLGVDGAANLFLINPNGIIFGENAVIDVRGSFTATSADAVLLGENGLFSATNPDGSNLIDVAPSALFYNQIRAFSGAIENSGRLTVANGQNLTLSGDTVINSGTLEAPGGIVALFGNEVNLINNAVIDVSSDTGGGIALIGGDYQGTGTGLIAQQTFVGSNVEIKADALQTGDGGKVIVWADDTTQFYGNISARGGAVSGDGGFVEVSGKNNLTFNGLVDTSAVNGNFGTLLLDPTNIFVVATGQDTDDLNDVDDPNDPDLDPANQRTSISNTAINNANADVTLAATNDINFDAPVNITAPGVGLTADAGNDINVNEDITTNGGDVTLDAVNEITVDGTITASNLNLITPNQDVSFDADTDINFNAPVNIVSPGIGLTANATGNDSNINVNQNITTNGGNVTLNADNNINVNNVNRVDITTNGGDILLEAERNITVTNAELNSSLNIANREAANITLNAKQGNIDISEASEIINNANNDSILNGFPIITIEANQGRVDINGSNNDRSTITTDNDGSGFTGDINIDAADVSIVNSEISSNGNFGRVFIGRDIDGTFPSSITIQGSEVSTTNQGSIDNDAGPITIIAEDSIEINNSFILSTASNVGNGGSITIEAGRFDLLSGAFLNTSAFGGGNAGNIDINAQEVALTDFSGIFANNIDGTTGSNVTLTGITNLTLANSEITTFTDTGVAGNISINQGEPAAQSVTLTNGAIRALALTTGGQAGNVEINAQEVELTDNSGIFADNIDGTTGSNVTLTGITNLTLANSEITTFTDTGAAGNISINQGANPAQSATLTNGAIQALAFTTGGEAGNVDINAQEVTLTDSAIAASNIDGTTESNVTLTGITNLLVENSEIAASTESGIAGDITISASGSVILDGQGTFTRNPGTPEEFEETRGGIFAEGTTTGGSAGNITITAPTLTLSNNTQISAQNIDDTTESNVTLTGITNLLVENSEIAASTESGIAGDITISASGSVILDGQGTFTRNPGTLEEFEETRGGIFAEGTTTGGSAGNITITAPTLTLSNNTQISAQNIDDTTESNVTLTGITNLLVEGNSNISTATETGEAGNVFLNQDEGQTPAQSVTLNQGRIAAAANSNGGNAGSIEINTQAISLENNSQISAATEGVNTNGSGGIGNNIELDNVTSLNITDSSISTSTGTGIAGSVLINQGQTPAQSVTLSNGTIAATADENGGEAGSVALNAQEVAVSNNSRISAQNIDATTESDVTLTGINNLTVNSSEITASTASGRAGNISINQDEDGAESVRLNNGTIAARASAGAGNAGQVAINTANLTVEAGGEITTSTVDGNAGTISIDNNDDAAQKVEVTGDNSSITSEATGTGNSNNIDINARQVIVQGANARISTSNQSGTFGGTVNIRGLETNQNNLPDGEFSLEVSGGGSITTSTGSGLAGNVLINSGANEEAAASANLNNGIIETAATETGGSAGSIALNAQEVTLTNSSQISAENIDDITGSDVTLTGITNLTVENSEITASTETGAAGSILINQGATAAESVTLNNGTIAAAANDNGGNAGSVEINAQAISLENNSQISATTQGVNTDGEGGQGENIELNNVTSLNITGSSISTSTETGIAGSVLINQEEGQTPAQSVTLNNGIIAATANDNGGQAGSVALNAQEVTLTNSSQISAANIDDTTESNVTLTGITNLTVDSSEIAASTESGIAGNVTVNASESVTLDGQGTFTRNPGTPEEFEETRGGIFAEATETGQPGSITLGSAANPISELVIQNGAEISTAAKDIGDNETLGNITVTANNVTLNNEGIINSRTDGTRNAGRISITANNEFKITTGGSIEAESTASGDLDAGNAGDVSITALIIDIDNGTISSQAQDNQATGGDITLLATGSQEAIAIKNNSRIEASSNSDPDQNNDSSSTSKVDIAATNGSINVSDSEVTTANSGSAVAGTLTIAAKDSISITNSNISSDGNFGRIGIGDPTNLDLEISDSLIPSNIVIQDSQITTNSNIGDEEGGSGTIRIQAQGDIEIRDISSEPDTETLISTTTFGDAFDLDGLIEITANNLTVDNGKIQSNSGSSGNGRFIFLNINNKFILSGEDGEISTNTVDGDGGAIFIAKDTEPALQALLDEDLSSVEDVDITLLTLRAANVDLEATSIIEINDGTISTSTQSIGDGGLIKIESNNLTINNGTITSNAQGSGNAGTIFLDINDKLNLSEPNSQILSTSTDGTGGTIIIAKDTETAVQEFLNSDSDIEAVANVDLEATSTVEINGGVISATTRGSGNAGLIRIESGDLIVGNQDEQNGRIRIESRSQSIEEDSGNAGNIILNAENNISLNNVTISSQAVGRNAASGDVILSATGQDIENTDGSIEPSIMIRDSIIEANSNNDDSELLFSTILIEARQGSININNSTVTTDNNGSAFAGNVEIYAADDIVIENNSTISSNGDFGFVLIGDSETDKVTIQNSQIRATNDVSTDSSSQAGLIEIQAQGNIESNSSEISGTTSGAGVGGSITISSENGNFTSTGSIIEASSTGLNDTGDEIPAGEAGNIFITAGNININDTNIDNTAQDSDAGSVSLQADSSIRLIDTTIDVAAFGLDGKSGDITIEALNEGTVELISQDPDSLSTIFIESFADLPGEKTGGNLSIIGGSINIEGYQLDARVFGEGDGGNISIVGNSITILNGSEIITETTSRGNAGDISIQAQDNIEISDINSESDTSTLISSNTSGEGNGGDITITSVQGSITSIPENAENNPGRIEITSESETSGNAGTITLNATNEQLGNITLDNARVSSQATDIGDSNDITLNSPVVVLQNNTEVTAQTNSGESGTVVFSDIKTLDVINSVVSSSTQSGQAQSITINSVDTENGSVTIDGQGTFTRDDGTSETRGGIFTEATETGGRAGSLTINASTLSLSNNTQLSASNVDDQTANEGENLKNINLNVDNLTVENSEITISTESGVAGNVTVNGSEGTANASESVTINGQGTFTRNSGTPEEFEETRGGIFAEAENSGQAGNINIFTSNLTVKNKTEISSNAQNTANAGNIELQIGNQLSLDDATIDVSTFDGNPGNIFINNDDNPVPEIRIQNGATISANRGNGQEDNLSEQSLIRITTNNLTIENQSTIESNTFGRGDGGDILIEIVDDQIVDDPNQGNLIITRTGNSDETTGVVADARGTGRGGTIIIAKDINDELIDAIREINAGSSLSDINNRINNFSEPVEPIDRVIMSNGATISANTNTDEKGQNLISGERTGGNIFISTLALSQDNDSNITAGIPKLSLEERNQLQIEIEETEEITAGNILLKLDGDRELQEDNLFSLPEKTVILSNDSDIRTEGSEGGKIFINARFVIASDNSDVITTFTGGDFTGGDADIAILDDGLVVGLREREQDTPLNDITGNNVTINSPEIDNQLVPQLSQEVVDVSSLIDRRCAISSGDNVSSFTMVGQGGLPPNLDKFLSIPDILPDFGTFEPEIEENSDKTQTITPSFSFAKSNLQAEVAAYTTTWKFPQNCFAASVDK